LFISSFIHLNALEIDNKTTFHNLLPHAEIYIDKTKSLTLQEILKLKNEFKANDKKILAYGYSPHFDVWVRFTLHNTTNKPLEKIVEYDNPLTTHIEFFNPKDDYVKEEGSFHVAKERRTLNPIFHISLKPQESKTFYIHASSHITTLIVKVNLYKKDVFYAKELQHHFYMGLFFAALFILGIYNLSIYFFTKDVSYLYYVLSIFGIIAHQMIYAGIANIYLFSTSLRISFIEHASFLVAFSIYFLALFTKSFLELKQYKVHHKILTIYLIVFPFFVSFFTFTEQLSSYRDIFTLLLLIYLFIITIYATLKKNRQAYFILFGWLIILMTGSLMYISSLSIFDIHQYLPYLVEISFVSEAIIFSIALTDRIKQLQREKENATNKLLTKQRDEQEKFKLKVAKKTIDLKKTLGEKEMLLKELNHRVKNNMQTIVSLIRLQIDELEDEQTKQVLSSTHNRISAMSHLHELLNYHQNISNINANDYFSLLSNDILESYHDDIKIHLNILSDIKLEQAISCGLIVNELLTNAFKHAFPNKDGNIYVRLWNNKKHYFLSVRDDGTGYDKDIFSHSLGLTLVEHLVKSKLGGTLKIYTKNGVTVIIKWEHKSE